VREQQLSLLAFDTGRLQLELTLARIEVFPVFLQLGLVFAEFAVALLFDQVKLFLQALA